MPANDISYFYVSPTRITIYGCHKDRSDNIREKIMIERLKQNGVYI